MTAPLKYLLVTTRGRQTSDHLKLPGVTGSAAHLQARVAEHHELGASVHVVAFDEGEVHPADPPQAREVRTPLPVLRVVLHHLLLETLLFPAAGNKQINEASPSVFAASTSELSGEEAPQPHLL